MSAGRFPVKFERLDVEVNWVGTGWSRKWELKDVRESIHRDCFHKVETSISSLHYQKEILDLCCWPET
jgi:hypothetical protein